MTQTLPQVTHEHHERIIHQVDQMPALADQLLTSKPDENRDAVLAMREFLVGTLVPHVDTAERNLYPQLERMLQNRHSMTPMRKEHDEIRRLAAEYARQAEQYATGHAGLGRTFAMRRVMFHVYALVKIHLAEEEAYLRLIESGVSADVSDVLAAAMEHPVTV